MERCCRQPGGRSPPKPCRSHGRRRHYPCQRRTLPTAVLECLCSIHFQLSCSMDQVVPTPGERHRSLPCSFHGRNWWTGCLDNHGDQVPSSIQAVGPNRPFQAEGLSLNKGRFVTHYARATLARRPGTRGRHRPRYCTRAQQEHLVQVFAVHRRNPDAVFNLQRPRPASACPGSKNPQTRVSASPSIYSRFDFHS